MAASSSRALPGPDELPPDEDLDLQRGEIKTAWDATTQEGGVKRDVFGRRTWDKDFYEERGAERDSDEDEGGEVAIPIPASQRLHLTRRNQMLDLEKDVGKTKIEAANAFDAEKGGFYCPLCQKLMRDNMSFLDHLNGKRHLRMMGMTTAVRPATLDEVKLTLEVLRKRKAEKKGGVLVEEQVTADDILDKMDKAAAEAAEQKAEKKAKKKRKKEEAAEMGPGFAGVRGGTAGGASGEDMEDGGDHGAMEEDEDAAMMRAMGLPVGFKSGQ